MTHDSTFSLEITCSLLKSVLCFKLPNNSFLLFACAQVKKNATGNLNVLKLTLLDSNRKVPNLHANHLFLRTIMYQVKSKSPHHGRVFLSSNLKIFHHFHFFLKCLPPAEESFSRMESSCWPFSWLGGYGTMARNTWEERSRKFCLYTNTYTRVEPWGWKVCTNHLFLLLIERNKRIIIVSQLFFQVHPILLWGMLSKKVSLTLCLPFPTVIKWAGKEDWHVSSLGTGFEKCANKDNINNQVSTDNNKNF